MYRTLVAAVILALSGMASGADGASEPNRPAAGPEPGQEPNAVRVVLDKLQAQAGNLKSYQCKVDYVFKQPLFESTERRRGTLQYARIADRSYLYIDFATLQFDQEKEQKKREQYLFDGVWLTFVDHENLSVQRRQVAEPNAPVDAFALASRRVPIMGFAKVEDMEKQFTIERVTPKDPADSSVYELHMKTRPDSTYKDDYTTVDMQIDKKQGLPTKIVAVTPDQDVYEIRLTDSKVNADIPKSTFEISYPKNYSVEAVPLEKNRTPTRQP